MKETHPPPNQTTYTITDTSAGVFDQIAMDIVGPSKKTPNSNEYILTLQDQLIETSSASIDDAFIKKFICIFGCPKMIPTDQGQNFSSSLMRRIAKRFKIKKLKTTAFRPQSNGFLERPHHVLAEYLRLYTEIDCNWDDYLNLAMLSYNTCVQESTEHNPYEVVFRRLARMPSNCPLGGGDTIPTYKDYITELVTRLHSIQELANENLVQSKKKSKAYYHRKINPKNFELGDFVFLKAGPKPNKFGDQYSETYKIIAILGKNKVKIETKKGS